MSTVDEVQRIKDLGEGFLAHYGVKGMRWGVRSKKRSAGPEPGDAEDHTRARSLHTVAKTQGTRKLTNKDLEALNKRLNLEQNYSNLTTKTKQSSAVKTGASWFGSKVRTLGDRTLDDIAQAHLRVALTQKGIIPQGSKK